MNGAELSVVGTLGRDFELRYTTGGRAVANAGLACSRRYQKNNEWVEETIWFNLVIWGDMAERACAGLTKGTRCIVSGRLQQREWETNEGEKRTTIELVVDEIGPSVRWADVEVTKTEREKSDGSSGYQAANQAAGGATGKAGGTGYGGDDYPYGSEEPF